MTDTRPRIPRATYRLQFNRDFTFRDALALVPYLADLGISHIYASPYLKALPGSTHGYDIVDHNALNPEIGDADDLAALTTALHAAGMGQIADFVPNHMGIARADNVYWLDVLEWGRASPYARWFDIDWEPTIAELRGKVLLPFLGDQYGRVLEAGELRLAFDGGAGTFSVWYHEHRYPIAPRRYARILSEGPRLAPDSAAGAALQHLAESFRALRTDHSSPKRIAPVRAQADALKRALADLYADNGDARDAIEAIVDWFNGTPGQPQSFTHLHRLLELQAYRLTYWRVAAHEINYRRFFDINDLAALRMESAALFETAHRLTLELIAKGQIDGLRLDHVDGLLDPARYCARLQDAVARARPNAEGPFYVLVEKILGQHEHLRTEWPVAGTTGYDFLNQVNGLFVDARGLAELDRTYARFLGRPLDFDEVLYAAKQFILDNVLAGELNVLAGTLARIAESNWSTRDFTLNGLRQGLKEVIAAFPVYRTYVTPQGVSPEDRRDIDWALGEARRRTPLAEPGLYDFIHGALTTDLVRGRARGYSRRAVIDFAMNVQQYTGPVMAKALEDTSFYRYSRLISLNDVGGDPRRSGVSVAAFHHLNQERARHWPHAMLATATHDTKRGEDARARINVLSELAREWSAEVRIWARANRRFKSVRDEEPVPAPNDEYLLYQTLIGTWPLGSDDEPPDDVILTAYRTRTIEYMIKALREAKRRSSWAHPNAAYEDAFTRFIEGALEWRAANPFLAAFLPFQRRVARAGALNGLAQLTLKLAAPGVPDIYRGCELWDLSLVDPDNRRPVDFDHLRALLAEVAHPPAADTVTTMLDHWRDGRIKIHVLARILALRKAQPALFAEGDYAPLSTEGALGEHVCAFRRAHGESEMIVCVPRLVARLLADDAPRIDPAHWQGSAVIFPEHASAGTYTNILTGEALALDKGTDAARLSLPRLFATLPLAVLIAT